MRRVHDGDLLVRNLLFSLHPPAPPPPRRPQHAQCGGPATRTCALKTLFGAPADGRLHFPTLPHKPVFARAFRKKYYTVHEVLNLIPVPEKRGDMKHCIERGTTSTYCIRDARPMLVGPRRRCPPLRAAFCATCGTVLGTFVFFRFSQISLSEFATLTTTVR